MLQLHETGIHHTILGENPFATGKLYMALYTISHRETVQTSHMNAHTISGERHRASYSTVTDSRVIES